MLCASICYHRDCFARDKKYIIILRSNQEYHKGYAFGWGARRDCFARDKKYIIIFESNHKYDMNYATGWIRITGFLIINVSRNLLFKIQKFKIQGPKSKVQGQSPKSKHQGGEISNLSKISHIGSC